MAIVHPTVKVPGNKLFAAADWNAGHTIQPDTLLPNVISPDDTHHYFGTGKDVDMYFQSATNFFRLINGSNYFLLPRTTSPEIKSVYNINMILGDNAGARYFAILNSTPAFVFKCDSIGRITLPHIFTNSIQFSLGQNILTSGLQYDFSTHALTPRIIPTHALNFVGAGSTVWYIEVPNQRFGYASTPRNVWLNYLVLAGSFNWSLDYIDITGGGIFNINFGGPIAAPGPIDLMIGAGPLPVGPNYKLALTITTLVGFDNVDVFGLNTFWV